MTGPCSQVQLSPHVSTVFTVSVQLVQNVSNEHVKSLKNTAPQHSTALLDCMVTLVNEGHVGPATAKPPPFLARLNVIALSLRINVLLSWLMAPPRVWATLLSNVTAVNDTTAPFSSLTAPPLSAVISPMLPHMQYLLISGISMECSAVKSSFSSRDQDSSSRRGHIAVKCAVDEGPGSGQGKVSRLSTYNTWLVLHYIAISLDIQGSS